jgi:hypothetical protein
MGKPTGQTSIHGRKMFAENTEVSINLTPDE